MHTQQLHSLLIHTVETFLADPPGNLVDVAILGSLSGHYGWKSTSLADADVWILARDRSDPELRRWLLALSARLETEVRAVAGARFESRAIDGPYKPSPSGHEETFLLHLLVDDEDSYARRSALTRYSWRKYRPFRSPSLLESLSPPRPTAAQLVADQWGIAGGLEILRTGVVRMPELCLETGQIKTAVFARGTFQFWEASTYLVMMAARNRARIAGWSEPDSLPNEEFGIWYEATYNDKFVSAVVRSKDLVASGEAAPTDTPGAFEWLVNLRASLREGE